LGLWLPPAAAAMFIIASELRVLKDVSVIHTLNMTISIE